MRLYRPLPKTVFCFKALPPSEDERFKLPDILKTLCDPETPLKDLQEQVVPALLQHPDIKNSPVAQSFIARYLRIVEERSE